MKKMKQVVKKGAVVALTAGSSAAAMADVTTSSGASVLLTGITSTITDGVGTIWSAGGLLIPLSAAIMIVGVVIGMVRRGR